MSKSINNATILGNIGKDPEVKYTPAGTPVARISVATNERFKDKLGNWKERTEWHNVILWARLAEIAKEHLHKGSKICVVGALSTRSWDKNGDKHYMTEIVARDLIMLDGRKAAESSPAAAEGQGPITDEDIPF